MVEKKAETGGGAVPPTPEDLARDLLADLALCNPDRAKHGDLSPGPWRESRIARHDAEGDYCGHDLYVLDAAEEEIGGMHGYDDNALVVAAREALPAAIRRALSAEARLARVEEVLRSVTRDYPSGHLVVSVIRERLAKE